ncbi:hypothetical protein V8G54_037000 [Vigna mungo]|uniref:J domain-containing protein n=1 Tax=Vigna mungo TaxID=3915 RepID=A0AAQ3MHS3_VIGMU
MNKDENDRNEKKANDIKLWGVFLFGLLGAAVTAFSLSRSQSRGASGSSFRSSFQEEAWKRYNKRLQEEYEEEVERVERIKRMQSVFNRERDKRRRSYESWRGSGGGADHQHFQRDDWYWKAEESFREHQAPYGQKVGDGDGSLKVQTMQRRKGFAIRVPWRFGDLGFWCEEKKEEGAVAREGDVMIWWRRRTWLMHEEAQRRSHLGFLGSVIWWFTIMVGHGGDALGGLAIGFTFPLVLFLGFHCFCGYLQVKGLQKVERHGDFVIFGTVDVGGAWLPAVWFRTTPYTDAEIETAFRTKAMQYHPDQNQDNREASEAKFKEVMCSYEAIQKERKNQNL